MPSDPTPAGLTSVEAVRQLTSNGPNALPRPHRCGLLRLIVDVLRGPMLALLLAGGLIYLTLGNQDEALVLLVSACMSVGITVVQKARTERALAVRRDLNSPRALVFSDGRRRRIAGRNWCRAGH